MGDREAHLGGPLVVRKDILTIPAGHVAGLKADLSQQQHFGGLGNRDSSSIPITAKNWLHAGFLGSQTPVSLNVQVSTEAS